MEYPDPYTPYEEPKESPQYPCGSDYQPKVKQRRGGWVLSIILGILLLLVLSLAVVGFNHHYDLLVDTDNGLSIEIQPKTDAKTPSFVEKAKEPIPDMQVPAASIGTGITLEVEPDHVAREGLSLQEIYQKVVPSVVSITAYSNLSGSSGTGIVMTRDGYIITNQHVVQDAIAIEILLHDDRVFEASLVGSDDISDLAVLKIDADDLTPAEFGESESMVVGDMVVAIGDPLGVELRGTMTDGIISAINRDVQISGRSMTMMQTNAALNSGNSGGPLINSLGKVIGINTMKMGTVYTATTVEGLGFAIPIATAKPIVDELIEKGYVSGRPFIGISGESLPAAVRAYYHLPKGVYVTYVQPDTGAQREGIQIGDILCAINGDAVENMEQLELVKNKYAAGEVVTVTIFREGDYYQVDVELCNYVP